MPKFEATALAAVNPADRAVMLENDDNVDVFVCIDVGKGTHHAVALNQTDETLLDRPIPHDEAQMRGVLQNLNDAAACL